MTKEQSLAHRICETFAGIVQEKNKRIEELEDVIEGFVHGIEANGGEKWMPHRVARAKEILAKGKWSF